VTIAESKAVVAKLPVEFSEWESSRRTLSKLVIVRTQWYPELIDELERTARDEAARWAVSDSQIELVACPGALELPQVVRWVGSADRNSAVVAIGCVVQGDTPHFDYVCQSAILGLQREAIEGELALGNGVLTVKDLAQARARISKGAEAVQAALWMYHLKVQFLSRIKGGHGISTSQP
jgi:6,7-dimethyl-8-ribityllumazine synthase